jgi:hypothetical protein
MKAKQMIGVVALVLGAVLLGTAYQSSPAPLHQILSAFTGPHVNQTMGYLLGGMIAALGGGLLAIFGDRLE